jgi:zinc protease
VAAEVLIKNGGEADPPELAGLANLTAGLLAKGTEKRNATQIAEAIEALGGELNTSARWDASAAGINVTSSKIAPAMEILADVIRRPTFKADEVERLRQLTLDDLTVEMGEPGSIAGFVANRVVFGDGPYGHPIAGTQESLTRIDRDDLIKFHSKFYRPDNTILVLGGDVNPVLAFALAQRYFGDWIKPKAALPPAPESKPVALTQPRVVVIDKPDAGQAAVVLVRSGIDRKDADYFRGIVTNSVLSGYSGRLNQEIRIKRGLSYGARSVLDSRRSVGPFTASAQTKNPSAAQVAGLLMGEISRLSAAPVPELELTPRKAVVIGNFARAMETANGMVGEVDDLALYGLSFDEINRFIANAQGVSADDIQRFAGSKLDSRTSSIVIVGNAGDFLPELKKEYRQVEVIPVAELDLNTALLRKKQQAKP